MMGERIKGVSIVLRVDTDRRRLERMIAVPDGSSYPETAFLVQRALSTLGDAKWREVPMSLEGEG